MVSQTIFQWMTFFAVISHLCFCDSTKYHSCYFSPALIIIQLTSHYKANSTVVASSSHRYINVNNCKVFLSLILMCCRISLPQNGTSWLVAYITNQYCMLYSVLFNGLWSERCDIIITVCVMCYIIIGEWSESICISKITLYRYWMFY